MITGTGLSAVVLAVMCCPLEPPSCFAMEMGCQLLGFVHSWGKSSCFIMSSHLRLYKQGHTSNITSTQQNRF